MNGIGFVRECSAGVSPAIVCLSMSGETTDNDASSFSHIMSYNEQDWMHRTLQFIFGAIIGTFMGIGLSSSFPDFPVWMFIVGTALILGIVAAIMGDKLWHSSKWLWPW